MALIYKTYLMIIKRIIVLAQCFLNSLLIYIFILIIFIVWSRKLRLREVQGRARVSQLPSAGRLDTWDFLFLTTAMDILRGLEKEMKLEKNREETLGLARRW